MKTDSFGASPSLPQSYFVPRGGRLVRVRVDQWSALRRLRTELELLRRIHYRATRPVSAASGTSPTWQGKYSQGERRDLRQILRDAARPVVEEMIALIDREFSSVRKELIMSIVNEESDNIVRDAVDAGVVDPGAKPEAPTDPAEAVAALASVEAGLADAIGEHLDAVNDAIQDNPPDATPKASDSDFSEPPKDEPAPAAIVPQVSSDPADLEMPPLPEAIDMPGEEPISETAEVATVTPDPAPAPELPPPEPHHTPDAVSAPTPEKAMETPVAPETNAPSTALPPAPFDSAYTPERAEQAVREIELGIQKLANILRNEVDEQWQQARNACTEIAAAREDLDGVHGKASDMLDDIARLREEAELAREGAELARREAKLYRDDADRLRKR